MKKYLVGAATIAVLGFAAATAGNVFGAQGSGGSADTRSDDFVVICHYDRNQQGPNAGPHTITVNVNALDHHLADHVKAEGFVGDDSLGPCPGTTPEPTRTGIPVTATPELD